MRYHRTATEGPQLLSLYAQKGYLREELLAKQVATAIANVALLQPEFEFLSQALQAEAQASSQEIARQKLQIENSQRDITQKLQRLLDAHLENLIDKSEFQQNKQTLLQDKIALEEKCAKMTKGAISWLEPCTNFLKAAHQAGQLSESANLESQKNFLKKVGSNFRITARLLTFAHREPWALIPKFYCNFNRLPAPAAHLISIRPLNAGVENFHDRVQLTEMRKR